MSAFTIAIDGPAAAGKGTISRAVAERFGMAHLDTGLLYRAVGAKCSGDPELAEDAARSLNDADLARDDLRTAKAGEAASKIAAIPAVRAALLDYQRDFARRDGGAVLDGRDIGTVICPDAEVKLYVTASAEVRAERRFAELQAAGADTSLSQVLADVKARDQRDMDREDAPLRPADDANVIDTSAMAIEEAVAAAISAITAKRQG